MPRKASGRKAASKSGKTRATAAERSAQRQTGKEIPDTPQGSDVERIAAKNANPAHRAPSEQTARLNAASQTNQTSTEEQAKPPAEVSAEDLRKVQATQGPNGHPLGSAKAAKPNLNAASVKLGGVSKVLREKGEAPKPFDGHVVQPGGGGAPLTSMGEPIR